VAKDSQEAAGGNVIIDDIGNKTMWSSPSYVSIVFLVSNALIFAKRVSSYSLCGAVNSRSAIVGIALSWAAPLLA